MVLLPGYLIPPWMGTAVRDHTDTALKNAVPPKPPQGADESNRKTDIAKLVSHLRISWLPVESLSLVLGESTFHTTIVNTRQIAPRAAGHTPPGGAGNQGIAKGRSRERLTVSLPTAASCASPGRLRWLNQST